MSRQFDTLIQGAVDRYLPQNDWRLLKAQLLAESNLNPNAVSPVGAMGIAQFMPETWRQVSREMNLPSQAGAFDPKWAIPASAFYMRKLWDSWSAPRPDSDRYCLALASYNAGLGNLLAAQKRAGGVNDYAAIIRALPLVTGHHARETTHYVGRIWRLWAQQVGIAL